MVVTCDIEFENNVESVYYAGQVIMGKVTLTADKIKQVKAVSLKILGSAKTKWRTRGLENRRDKICQGEVEYINTVTCLLGQKITDHPVFIEPGIHTFSFACHIPRNCPSSFEGDHGCIRYVLQVILERPWKFDVTFSKGFMVLTNKNLNYDTPLLKLPAKNNITKNFCCGPLQINVQLPQTGYVPGQLIPISISITNNTVSLINEIITSLVMVITYSSTVPKNSTTQRKIISKLFGNQVLRNCKKNFNYLLPIPATPPTCTTFCNILQITYSVEVEVNMQSILQPNQCIRIPVTIGNVPLQSEARVVQQQPLLKEMNLAEESRSVDRVDSSYDSTFTNENIAPWSTLNNIPAPAFLAANHMPKANLAEDTDHEYGEKEFTPKYPVFDVPSPLPLNGNAMDDQADPSMLTEPNKTTWL